MKIGIFWYYNKQPIGIAHQFSADEQDSLGLVDSPYTHVEYWEVLRQQVRQLRFVEYEKIPRGRVIFNAKTNKAIVYMDSSLFKKTIAKQIALFFDLDFEQVVWKKDTHYRT